MSVGKCRLGASAIAQVYGQMGNECPDVDDPGTLKSAFDAIQELISKNLLLAGHDVSDGGLITTLLEMAFAGNCGLSITMDGPCTALKGSFAEELGAVIECRAGDVPAVTEALRATGVKASVIGETAQDKRIAVMYNGRVVLQSDMPVLRQLWEDTSYQTGAAPGKHRLRRDGKTKYFRPQRAGL